MALTDSDQGEKKPVEVNKGTDKKEKPLTKVIIRRLPPNMDQETFLNQVSPVPTYDYFYMVKGDASWGENAFSRAYINFTNPNDIFDFKEKFDNYVFLDNAGHEYPAVVEFAAFQKIPKKRSKVRVDSRIGTIESDPYYQEFIEMLNKPPEQDEKPEYTYQITNENKNDVMTPLLEFVKHKRAERLRIREERREERKRKEFERKKFRDDERKKRFDDKPSKSYQGSKVSSPKEKVVDLDSDKLETEQVKNPDDKPTEKESDNRTEKSSTSYYKNRDKKFDDRKKDMKNKYTPKKEAVDRREFKGRRDEYKDRGDYRSKYDDYKKDDSKQYQKKVKKYSEKREERKIEAQKAEQKKLEQAKEAGQPSEKTEEKSLESPKQSKKEDEASTSKSVVEKPSKSVDESGRRIRNKDRPTIAIYRPGMLSKRKQPENESDVKESNKKE